MITNWSLDGIERERKELAHKLRNLNGEISDFTWEKYRGKL